jgi:exodeoxyribonuclease-5
MGLLELSLTDLPALDVTHLPLDMATRGAEPANAQTRDIFAAEAAAIANRQAPLTWLAPSRDESASGAVFQKEDGAIWATGSDDQHRDLETTVIIRGGRERGLILHKLMEEVLTGETDEASATLTERAGDLIRALGRSAAADPAAGLSAKELSDCVVRTLAVPQIAALRRGLLAEFPVYAANSDDGMETATLGIVDALTLTAEGRPAVVVDWKSDVNPAPGTLDHYRSQVRAYLDITSAERGLIVLMTTGTVIGVSPSSR